MTDPKTMIKQGLVTLNLFLALMGCSESHNKADLSFGIVSYPRTLDVRFATDASSFRIAQLLYQAPVRFNHNSEPIPWLCDWTAINHDHFRFTIKGDPTFESGDPITALDIKATYESILDEKNASPHKGSLQHIKSITALDKRTLDIKLSKPDPAFPATLLIGVLPKQWLDQPQGNAPASGAFQQLGAWDGESDLRLKRRSDGMTLRFIKSRDATVRTLRLLSEDVDIIQNNLPPELVKWLSDQPEIQIKKTQGSTFSYLGFNLKDPITSDIRLRQAIAHALDRQSIIDHFFANAARPALGLFPPEHWAGNAQLKSHEYNPRKAKALIKSMGYDPSNPLVLSYKTSKNPFRLRLATVIQDQLSKVGIQLTIQSYDWGTFYGDIKAGRFQLYSLSWVGLKNVDAFRYIFHSSSAPPQGANRGQYLSATSDRLIEQAEQTVNPKQRRDLFHQLQAQIHKDLPYVPLWYEDNKAFLSSKAQQYQVANDGNYLSLQTIQLQ